MVWVSRMVGHRREPPRSNDSEFGAIAVVAPLHARNTFDNDSNLSADSRAATELRLVVRSGDGGDVSLATPRDVVASVPNWLRIVLYYAGSTQGPSGELPNEVEVAVRVDPTGDIVAVDVERAESELAAYRRIATRWWKETEAPLADVRGLLSAPKDAIRGGRNIAGAWRAAAAQLRRDRGSDDQPAIVAHSEAERDHVGRTANVLSYRLADDPKQLGRIRASALEAGPMMVANVRSGSMAMADLETWLQFQERSGAITGDEAAAWRTEATES